MRQYPGPPGSGAACRVLTGWAPTRRWTRRRPQREPRSGLPERVTVYEVGPRDGLQNESAVVPAAVKAEFVRRLAGAGLGTGETTSFVDPRWVPQLADADEVLRLLGDEGLGPRRPVLVPNERGLD